MHLMRIALAMLNMLHHIFMGDSALCYLPGAPPELFFYVHLITISIHLEPCKSTSIVLHIPIFCFILAVIVCSYSISSLICFVAVLLINAVNPLICGEEMKHFLLFFILQKIYFYILVYLSSSFTIISCYV